MNILYDYQVLLNMVSGASRSFCEVAHILKSEGNQIKFSFQYSDNLFLKEILCEYHPFLPQLNFKGKSQLRNLIEIWNSRKDIRKNDFDLLHTTGEKIYFEALLKKP